MLFISIIYFFTTRWNSCFMMLASCVKSKLGIRQLLLSENKEEKDLTPDEWNKLACVKDILQHFDHLTKM